MSAPLRPEGVLRILPRAAAASWQWRVLLLWALGSAIPTALLTLPAWRILAQSLDHSAHAAQWARAVDLVMVVDVMARFGQQHDAFAAAGIAAALAWLAIVPLLNGLCVAAARAPTRLRLGELLHGALTEFGPMLRLLILSLLPLGIALGVTALVFKGVGRYAEHAVLESSVDSARWAALAAGALVLCLCDASLDAARAALALYPRRRSAVKAWWRGLKLVVRRPLRALALYLGLSVVAAFALAGFSLLRLWLGGATVTGFLAALLLSALIGAVTAWWHFGRLLAMRDLMLSHQPAVMAPPPAGA